MSTVLAALTFSPCEHTWRVKCLLCPALRRIAEAAPASSCCRDGCLPGCEQEIDDSVDRIVAGMEGTPMVDGKSKSLVAYHEVRHALCNSISSPCTGLRVR